MSKESNELEEAEGLAEVVEIGAERGYQFTEQDVQNFLSEKGIALPDSDEGELSEEALEAVSGGWFQNLRIRFNDKPPITIRQW